MSQVERLQELVRTLPLEYIHLSWFPKVIWTHLMSKWKRKALLEKNIQSVVVRFGGCCVYTFRLFGMLALSKSTKALRSEASFGNSNRQCLKCFVVMSIDLHLLRSLVVDKSQYLWQASSHSRLTWCFQRVKEVPRRLEHQAFKYQSLACWI